MSEPKPVRLIRGEGPLGTGVFVLGLRPMEGGALLGDRWALAAFVPLVPLGRVRLEPEDEQRWLEQPAGRPEGSAVAATYARGLAGLLFVLGCLTTAYLCVAESSWFAALGVMFGGGLPLLLLGFLDQTLQRRRALRAPA
jgi:hypothetical protein